MTDPLGAQSGAPATGQSAGTGDQGTGTAPAAGAQSGTEGTTPVVPAPAQSGVSPEEYERLKTQLQAADRRATENENALKEIRDKDMPALEKATRDLAEAQASLAAKDQQIAEQGVKLAFFEDNSFEWHNPTAAMQLLDRAKIQIDPATGAVTGMKTALDALSKAHPYLLKPTAADGDGAPAGGTGPVITPANRGTQGAGKTPRETMEKRFPALRGRPLG